jgi:hypothetical protein
VAKRVNRDVPASGAAGLDGSVAESKDPINRRRFIQSASGLIAVASVGGSCANPESPDAGRVRVTITGLVPGFTSAGEAVITGGDLVAPIVLDLLTHTSGEATVKAGTYHVAYEPPLGYAMAPGSAAEQDVTIIAGAPPTDVTFAVQQTGVLRLNVTGLQAGFTTAGRATITGGGLSAPLVLDPLQATTQTTLTPGSYQVAYEPPSGYTMASGSAAVQNANVVGGTTPTDVNFAVVQATGAVRVNVSGLQAGFTSAGQATITGASLSSPIVLNLTQATAQASLVPGSYHVSYAPPSGYAMAAGSSAEQDVTVNAGPPTDVNFVVQVSGGTSPTIAFAAQWRTTGQTDANFMDAGRFSATCCQIPASNGIETAASLGLTNWPTANAFVNRAFGSGWTATRQAEANLGNPVNGEHRYFRFFYQCLIPTSVTGSGGVEHGVESSDGFSPLGTNTKGWNIMRIPRTDVDDWYVSFRDIESGARYEAQGISLQRNKTYRIEWHVIYGASTYTIEIKVFDETGVQRVSEADFRNLSNQPLTGVAFAYTAAFHRCARVGNNGPSSNFPIGGVTDGMGMHAHGAFAYSKNGWLGDYNASAEANWAP